MKVFKEIYEYRELLKTNIKKDIRGKYKGSFLGILCLRILSYFTTARKVLDHAPYTLLLLPRSL